MEIARMEIVKNYLGKLSEDCKHGDRKLNMRNLWILQATSTQVEINNNRCKLVNVNIVKVKIKKLNNVKVKI
jgi:hypothetical protein